MPSHVKTKIMHGLHALVFINKDRMEICAPREFTFYGCSNNLSLEIMIRILNIFNMEIEN